MKLAQEFSNVIGIELLDLLLFLFCEMLQLSNVSAVGSQSVVRETPLDFQVVEERLSQSRTDPEKKYPSRR